MSVRKLVVLAFACALPLTAALACGPDFPQNLLDDRKASLLDLPDGSFAFEAAHLLPKSDDHLHVVEGSPWDDANAARATGEAVNLSADEVAKVEAMRAAHTIGSAASAGDGLAPELLDYTLGALAFKAGDMPAATAQFRRVLALSPVERPRRGLWAQYMLARSQLATGNTDSAIAAFDLVRERAQSGAADPLGLAVASFGEQARMQWHRGNSARAVALYAQQAAHGSRSGIGSLLFVARSILAHPDMLERALDDSLTQRLLAAYYYARTDEFAVNWPAAGTHPDAEARDTTDAARDRKSTTSVDIEGFLAAVQRHGLVRFDGADRLAAGAYRAGRYPLAAQLAAKSTTPLAAWVRAKLALRAGDHAVATNEYALAAKGFPVDESWRGDDSSGSAVNSPLCRVETERGVFALSRGDYAEAMARMYAGAQDHWPDAAYVAERVLTVDELKDFVDRNARAAPRRIRSAEDGSMPTSPVAQIRALLARRLLREGRDDDVLAYIDDPKLRAKAAALLAARRAGNAWKSNDRAAALYQQAQLTRTDGMHLIGTELAPDDAVWDGDYAMDGFPMQPPELVAHDEHVRLAASAVAPNRRFHYRYVAAGLAEQAAGLVPARSQAYAAMMCQATGWMLDTNPKRAAALYHRYLREGAWVRWGKDFGHNCPQPDFRSAASLPWRQRYWQARHFVRRAWPYGLGLLIVGVVVQVMRRRRRVAA